MPTFCQGTLLTTSSTRSRRQLVADVHRGDEVPDVRRVERAPEDAEALASPLAGIRPRWASHEPTRPSR